MTPTDETIKQLTDTLAQYNPVTNATMEKIAKAMIPLAMGIIGILFMIELLNMSKQFDREDGGMTTEVFMNIAMKYVIAFFLVSCSGQLIDAIMWIGIQMTKWINSIVAHTATDGSIPSLSDAPWYQKPLLAFAEMFAYLALGASTMIVKILVFLRMMQLYIVKAIAPILIAFFTSTELRSIAIGFFKHVMTFVLQGALLMLIIGLIPVITSNDYLSFGTFTDGAFKNAGTVMHNFMIYMSLIFKYVTIIFLLIGSQNLAKRFIGGM